MRAAKVQASLRIRAVSPEPSLLAHTSSESRGTFRQKARSLAPLNGWACAVEMCHDGMLEDTKRGHRSRWPAQRPARTSPSEVITMLARKQPNYIIREKARENKHKNRTTKVRNALWPRIRVEGNFCRPIYKKKKKNVYSFHTKLPNPGEDGGRRLTLPAVFSS